MPCRCWSAKFLNPEEKLAKIKPEKLAKTTMGKIDINYMSGKKHQAANKT